MDVSKGSGRGACRSRVPYTYVYKEARSIGKRILAKDLGGDGSGKPSRPEYAVGGVSIDPARYILRVSLAVPAS